MSVFCDGCDLELGEFTTMRLGVVQVAHSATGTSQANKFHLCKECGKQLLEAADPRLWPRTYRSTPDAVVPPAVVLHHPRPTRRVARKHGSKRLARTRR